MTVIAKNPIRSGFYPDPSICAVGEDFYMVHSSFAYFPGLPVFHSKDLAHWEQLGNVLCRESQLPLQGAGHSQGLFAPTIRYFDGKFYVICTNVSGGGNFVVTADDPAGPWSEPYYLPEADGIDPSLFFDTDGKCYYIGTHPNPAGCRYDGDWYIWIRELDLERMELVGEVHNVWNGAMRGVHWPEGPHLYKKGGYYYIVHAEGGTGSEHAVAVCRSRELFGPYENCFHNPVLTHRHLGKAFPVQYAGHADLVETTAGEWYMVLLAVRPLEGYTTLGRETFLAKVTWENDWPVVNPGVGRLTDTVEVGLAPWQPAGHREDGADEGQSYDFTSLEKLGSEFLFLRNPSERLYTLGEKGLCLSFGTVTLREKDSPSYIAVRQRHHRFCVQARLETQYLTDGRRAGIALVQSDEYHLRTELSQNGEKLRAQVFLCEGGQDTVLCDTVLVRREPWVGLRLTVDGLLADIALLGEVSGQEDGEIARLVQGLSIRSLSTEVAGGFVGCTVGMYAVADGGSEHTGGGTDAALCGTEQPEGACFSSFSYEGLA